MTQKLYFPIVIICLLSLASCVSSKKYKLSENKLKVAEERLRDLKRDHSKLNTDYKNSLEQEKARADEIVQLSSDTLGLGQKYRECEADKLEIMKSGASAEAKLAKQLADKQRELEAKEKLIRDKELALQKETEQAAAARAAAEQAMAEKEKQLEEKTKRLNELETLIAQQNAVLERLRSTVQSALVNFNSDELTVEMRGGKVYVSLSEKLLFKSGSASVDPKGKDALKKLAGALQSNPDISIMIEGHTDNVPLSSSNKYKDNWDLSVIRATSIVRILTKEGGLASTRVVPSGRGEFFPVADNATKDGRAKNRRTEIILSPKLDELFKLLEN